MMNHTIPLYETIYTERLFIRRIMDGDLEDLYEYITDPEVMKFEPLLTEAESRKWAQERIASNDFWAVCLTQTGKMIGDLYMGKGEQDHWEIGYMFNARYQRKGYATEAAGSLICRTFQIEGAHRISAFCSPENVASWKLLERLGFRREGHVKQNVSFRQDANGDPVWQDTLLYGILRDEWLNGYLPRRQALSVSNG